MNTVQIFKTLRKFSRNAFLGVFAANMLPRTIPIKRPLLLVVNTDPISRPGTHWVAICIGRDSVGEYFDSLGQSPPPAFVRFMNRHCTRWTTNSKQLQSVISMFCGNYVVYFCYFRNRGYTMQTIVERFSNDTALNDMIAHNFTCSLIIKWCCFYFL